MRSTRSCSSAGRSSPRNWPPPPPAPPPPPPRPPPPPPRAPPAGTPPAVIPPMIPASDKLFAEGMTVLQEGGHERALELFSAAWQEKTGHAGVAPGFYGVLLALKKNGDAAY